jgi:hypothetical protein
MIWACSTGREAERAGHAPQVRRPRAGAEQDAPAAAGTRPRAAGLRRGADAPPEGGTLRPQLMSQRCSVIIVAYVRVCCFAAGGGRRLQPAGPRGAGAQHGLPGADLQQHPAAGAGRCAGPGARPRGEGKTRQGHPAYQPPLTGVCIRCHADRGGHDHGGAPGGAHRPSR